MQNVNTNAPIGEDLVSQVAALNAKIETLQRDKTRFDAQREVAEEALEKAIKAYETEYGVQLSNLSFKELKKAILREYEEVSARVQEEHRVKSEVISLIADGKVDDAIKILGGEAPLVQKVEGTAEEQESTAEQSSEVAPEAVEEELVSTENSSLLDNGGGVDLFEEVPPAPAPKRGGVKLTSVADAFKGFGEDLFEEETSEDEGTDISEESHVETSKKAEKGITKEGKKPVLSFADDDDEELFGFGKALKGSKFGGES